MPRTRRPQPRLRTTLSWVVASLAGCTLSLNCILADDTAGAGRAQVATDSERLTLAEPAGFPTLHKLVEDSAYEEQSTAVLKQLGDLAQLAKHPALGFAIFGVTPGQQAERLGLQVGDSVVKIDGKRVWAVGDMSGRDRRETRKLTIVTASGKERIVRVAPGMIGIEGEYYASFE